jgi:hypothetical protein
MRRPLLSLVVLITVLAIAGCGGGGSSGSATGTASGAEVTPADAIAFISVNTDRDSGQWQQADDLLQKFPLRDEIIRGLNEELSDEGVDFRRDVLPVLGPTLDIAVVGFEGGDPQVVGLAQPADKAKFNELLEKGDQPAVHTELEGWTVFSDTQATLDAFTKAGGEKLADSDAFGDAMDELPEDANAKAYLDGGRLFSLLERELPGFTGGQAGELDWVSFALSSEDDGWKLQGAVKSDQSTGAAFTPTLLDRVPAGSLFLATFKGTQGTFDQLRKNPQFSRQSAQLEQLLGVRFDDLARILEGESAFYVREGSPFPEVTLITKPADPQAALRTVDRAVGKLAGFAGGARPTRTQIEGVDARKLALGRVTLYYGVKDDVLITTISPAAFGDVGSSIEDDDTYSNAVEAAGVPDETSGIFYVNIKDAIPLIEGFAQIAGEQLPPDVSANVAPLVSLIGYGVTEDGIATFSALLQVR